MSTPQRTGPDPVAIVGIRLKLRRAQEHLHFLNAEVDAYTEREPYAFLGKFNEERTRYEFRLREMERPPITWAVILGEAIHNLRSALDHAVYQLTLSHSGREVAGSGFPIFDDVTKYSKVDKSTGVPVRGSGLYMIRGTAPAVQAFIEKLQPYYGGDPADEPLWWLRAFWNQDKHRVLLLANGAVVDESQITVNGNPVSEYKSGIVIGPRQDGAVVGWVEFPGPAPPEVTVSGKFALQIAIQGFWDSAPSTVATNLDRVFERTKHVINSLLLRL